MRFDYGPFDGKPFLGPDDLFPPPQLARFILQHGQAALDHLDQGDEDDQRQELVRQLIEAGLLERDPATGELRLTPRMLSGLEHRAFMEIFAGLRRGALEGHSVQAPGRSDERTDGLKPYEFGDPLSEIDPGATLRHALTRQPRLPSPGPDGRTRLGVRSDDFQLHLNEGQADCATCILLDQSGSMMRFGRFYHAKRVALGMAAMVRKRYPRDTLAFAGFHSLASPLPERELPLAMPKPVTLYEHQVRLRIPLQQAQDHPTRIPQHFTNLQMGLRVARSLLARTGAANKQIFIITDGQPTAHIEASPSDGQDVLHLLYPPSPRTTDLTLQEAFRCRREGIRIASFALIEGYDGMEWVGFIEQLTRLTRGSAFYCAGEELGSLIIESYASGRKRKSYSP